MHNLTSAIEQRTPTGIAAGLGRLIASGRLKAGDRLPTVRSLAIELGVSPATVSQAWQALGAAGLIVSRGRNGTFVREHGAERMLSRSRPATGPSQPGLDLSRGTPDPLLLPALGPALSRVSQRAGTPSYLDLPIIPELLALLEETWPYKADAFTIVNGALDALSRSLEQVTRFGDRVVVENPGFPPFFDLLDQLGLEAIPVQLDEHGIVPASLEAALSLSPSVVILQPRAHNPTGASMTAERAEQLAGILAGSPRVVVIEDDHSGDISTAPEVSLGTWLPERVLRIRSYSKSHGPDLRIAALGGPAKLIDLVVARRMLGPGWTSRMLQTILFDLLTDAGSIAEVAHARETYAARQRALTDALGSLGVTTRLADGINAWLPVADEQSAIMELAASGIGVAGGSAFFVDDPGQAFVRVTAGALPDDVLTVAKALASAARPKAAHHLRTRWA
jgi:DNA-binding transcriptional MocR family regulator